MCIRDRNYKVGVVSSVNIDHATPAAFYAHQKTRKNYYEIGVELANSGFEYFAGGEFQKVQGDGTGPDNHAVAASAGYNVVTTQADAAALTAGAGKTLIIAQNLADGKAMNYAMDAAAGEWQLTDYVKKGIELLDNKKGFFLYNPGKFLPLGRTATMTMYFLVSLTVVSVIMLIVNVLISKKTTGKTGLAELNVLIAPKKILKHIAVALLLLCAAYGSLMVIQYLFDQDYRSWMTVFSAMKVEHWFIALKYLIFAFPMYIIMGMAVNFSHRTDIPEWKDTLISIIVNSAGVWIICLINILIAKTCLLYTSPSPRDA